MDEDLTAPGIPLKNTRTTFQRTKDARFFTGRVNTIKLSTISVTCTRPQVFERGDRFAFHVSGFGQDAFLYAVFDSVAPNEETPHYIFRIDGQIELKDSTHDARFVVENILADLDIPGFRVCGDLQVLDISANGLCLMCPTHLRKGDPAEITITQDGEVIKASVEVRYCLKDKTDPELNKVGFQLVKMDRISTFRWRALYHTVMDKSRWEAAQAQKMSA